MKKYYERKKGRGSTRELKLKICKRCNRIRPIYQVTKQLCSSCRQLERLYNNPKRYAKYLKKQSEKYWKNPQKKKDYNYKYYRTGNHGNKMRAYGRQYWREHKEKYAAYAKMWKKKNPDKVRASAKRSYYKNYNKNRDKKAAKLRAWRKKNPEKNREYMKKWAKSPIGIKWRGEYNKRPDVIARKKARAEERRRLGIKYIKTPEQKAREKAYRDNPKQKKKKHDYDLKYSQIKKAKRILTKL